MRALTAILAIVAGLVLLAAPASAHRADRVLAHKPAAVTKQQAPIKPDAAPRICLFSVGGKAVAAPSKATATNETAAHDPTDHTHPLGEDTHHQKASHSSLDLAHDQRTPELKGDPPPQSQPPPTSERVCGIEPTPPVRPPLG